MKNSNFNQKSIGIIGGMGPQASAKLVEVLINMCAKDFKVKSDTDFPEIILNSLPVPNFISNKKNIGIVSNILEDRIKKLEAFNPICFGIVCNTAYIMLQDLQAATRVPFVSIIDEVAKKTAKERIDTVGLLGTPTTINSSLYQNALAKHNIKVIIPSNTQIEIVERIIRNVLVGKTKEKEVEQLKTIANSLVRRGSRGIILGCTELPLVFPKDINLPIFDSIEILAKALLKKSISQN